LCPVGVERIQRKRETEEKVWFFLVFLIEEKVGWAVQGVDGGGKGRNGTH